MSGFNHVKAESQPTNQPASQPRSPVRERINDFSHGAGCKTEAEVANSKLRSCDLGPWTFGRHVDISAPGRYIDPVDNWYAMWLHFVGKLSGEMGKTNALALLSILNDFAYVRLQKVLWDCDGSAKIHSLNS